MRGKPENLKPRSAPKSALPPEIFRARLRDLGVSNAWLARKLGNAPHTVGKWANGELRVPGYAAFILDLLAMVKDGEKKWSDLHESD